MSFGSDDGLLVDGLQVVRDSFVTEDEVPTPLHEFRCYSHSSDFGDFSPVSSEELVQCLRRGISSSVMFTARERALGTLGEGGRVSAQLGAAQHGRAPGAGLGQRLRQHPPSGASSNSPPQPGSRALYSPTLGGRSPRDSVATALVSALRARSPSGTSQPSSFGRRTAGTGSAIAAAGFAKSRPRNASPLASPTGPCTGRCRSPQPSQHSEQAYTAPSSPQQAPPRSPTATPLSPSRGIPQGDSRASFAAPSFSLGSAAVHRGRSPKGRSPKSSPSPDPSRSPSGGCRLRGIGFGRCEGRSPPRAASPFNPQTDFDMRFELPQRRSAWHRFEARVGVADRAAVSWPLGLRARFQLIDKDAQMVLWESSDAL
ncbi:unnamed protein product, partial [Polarella glacialis]